MVPKDRVDALEVDLFILMNKNLLTIFKLTYYNNVDILKVSMHWFPASLQIKKFWNWANKYLINLNDILFRMALGSS